MGLARSCGARRRSGAAARRKKSASSGSRGPGNRGQGLDRPRRFGFRQAFRPAAMACRRRLRRLPGPPSDRPPVPRPSLPAASPQEPACLTSSAKSTRNSSRSGAKFAGSALRARGRHGGRAGAGVRRAGPRWTAGWRARIRAATAELIECAWGAEQQGPDRRTWRTGFAVIAQERGGGPRHPGAAERGGAPGEAADTAAAVAIYRGVAEDGGADAVVRGLCPGLGACAAFGSVSGIPGRGKKKKTPLGRLGWSPFAAAAQPVAWTAREGFRARSCAGAAGGPPVGHVRFVHRPGRCRRVARPACRQRVGPDSARIIWRSDETHDPASTSFGGAGRRRRAGPGRLRHPGRLARRS